MLQVEANGRVWRFEGSPVVVGRSSTADVEISGAGVSREHIRIAHDGHRWTVSDVSAHGSFTSDGGRISQKVVVGSAGLIVHLGSPDGPSMRLSVRPDAPDPLPPRGPSDHDDAEHLMDGEVARTGSERSPDASEALPLSVAHAVVADRFRRHRQLAIALAVLIPVMIWSIQVYEVSVRLDGFNGLTGRAANVVPRFPEASQTSGFLFWFLVSSCLSAAILTLVLSGLATYVDRIRTHLSSGVGHLRFLVARQDQHLLMLVAGALLVSVIVPAIVLPPLAIATLLAVILLPTSDTGREISRRIEIHWRGDTTFTLHRATLAISVMAVAGLLLPIRPRAALAAVGFLLVVFIRYRRDDRMRIGDLATLLLAVIAVVTGDAVVVLADDGGWSECVRGAGALGDLRDWWSCAGSQAIRDAARDGAAITGGIPPALQSFYPYSCPEVVPHPYGPGHPDFPEPKIGPSAWLPSDFRDPYAISDKLDDLRSEEKKTENLIDKILDLIESMLAKPGEQSHKANPEIEQYRRELDRLERHRRQTKDRIQREQARHRLSEQQQRDARRQFHRDQQRLKHNQWLNDARRRGRRGRSDARRKVLRRRL
jgi:hypothetical protein